MSQLQKDVLPPEALNGKSLGISVSESADLGQLGLFEDHFRLALGDIARTILFAGGCLYYGGHLRDDGYTQFLVDQLQRYGRRDKPFKICLAHTEHQMMLAADIADQREQLGLFGEIIFLNEDGEPVEFSENYDIAGYVPSPELSAKSLSGLRRFMAKATDGRIIIGGKRTGFHGRYPGIVEEAIVSVESEKPLYLAGGFGGATLDLVSILEPENSKWFKRYADENDDYEKLLDGLDTLGRIAASSQGWKANGLTPEKNALLAATYRPSEIAALVGYGLAKLS